MAKNYYCDSIDIAGSTIAILLLLWTTITIVLSYYCGFACFKEKIKNMVGLFCTNRHQFLYGNQRKISQYCQSPLSLLKCMRCNNIYILMPFNILFVSNQTILKRKSLCLKIIETIAILKRLLPILLTLPLSYNCSNID